MNATRPTTSLDLLTHGEGGPGIPQTVLPEVAKAGFNIDAPAGQLQSEGAKSFDNS